tara:strand:+ start:107 stop:907 length:801 start_codon:yes stop_codon:yes gene_type:complete
MNKAHSELKRLCQSLRLPAVYDALSIQERSPEFQSMTTIECINDALIRQFELNAEKKIERLQKAALLRWPQATLMDFKGKAIPVAFKHLLEFAQGKWLEDNLHIGITGPTGSGKTHLGCGIANELLMNQIPVLYVHYHRLIQRLKAAEKAGDDDLEKLMRKYTKVRVLFIDDWGMQPLTACERRLLFDLIEQRDQKGSLIVTSQYDIGDWQSAFSDKTVADSIIDRIIHYFIHIDWNDVSQRQTIGSKLVAKNTPRMATKTPKGAK